ncbi:cAMP-binding domain of CRP or a regulatory subunit of cAMP-dependent protein kinases [Salinimicrobium sediminis]|uniref:cAMP-binding domain of CRP or a regulatory subunit of cAMP-dependent protein kinases n=1 Tax=Salinimicrobium sediminis TaxID=1343891 RepID=A0A285X3P2_9FLAO|nr:Crp/Fnr family transcriptional regulator [Salinimicrobium sediminis]SOC79908.1 cAMP-binding domain of CRP or a regulatory subunit of cAMP-dependent protein kinases [Salinimicrobium sediminis]
MFEFLHQKVNETINITDEEFEYAKTLFIPKKLRKKRFLLEEGEPCIYTTFVEKGLLRSFTIDEKGNEHILQFGMEGWWVADLYSFLTGEPSEYNIEALEDCELLLITKSSWDLLLDEVPAFERYFRILIQNNLIATQRRLMGTISTTAEERYTKLLHDFPRISQRVPQHMIASYIGVTRETLSRLRSQMTSG